VTLSRATSASMVVVSSIVIVPSKSRIKWIGRGLSGVEVGPDFDCGVVGGVVISQARMQRASNG
jgi:hypothetical protein